MLHIILGILKVIGILLAAVILLILGIILAVLFVPIHYRISADKTPEKLAGCVRVTWLFRMIAVKVSYDHRIRQKLFEIRILGMTTETIKSLFGKLSKLGQKRKKSGKIKNRSKSKKIKKDSQRQKAHTVQTEQSEAKQENATAADERNKSEAEQKISLEEKIESVDPLRSEDISKTEDDVEAQIKEETADEKQTKYKRKKIYDKIKTVITSIITSIKAFIQKLIDKIQSVKSRIIKIQDKASGIIQKVTEIPNKIEQVIKLCEEYEAKEHLETIWKELLYLIRHYAPRKVRGYLHFGTGDPAKTGQILGILYMVLPVRAAEFSLQPEFTEAIWETEMKMTGRIRISHLALTAWRLFRNKKLMRTIKMLRKGRRK